MGWSAPAVIAPDTHLLVIYPQDGFIGYRQFVGMITCLQLGRRPWQGVQLDRNCTLNVEASTV
ncbi:hypothetical protein D3C73_1156930 [compost metagenome]